MRVRQGRDSGLLDAATIAVVEKRTVRLWANVVSAVWAEEVGDSAYCRQNLEGLARMLAR